MTLQFNMVALLLVFLIVLGLLSQNSAITISAAVLLIMQQTLLSKYIPVLEQSQFIFKLENGRFYFNRGIRRMACGERRAINE